MDGSDLVETDHVRRHYSGSTLYLMRNPAQRFYYMSKQSKNEVLIFKNFDSKPDVGAKCKQSRSDSSYLDFFGFCFPFQYGDLEKTFGMFKGSVVSFSIFLKCSYRRASCLLLPSSCHDQHATARKHRSSSLCFYVSFQ